MLYYLCYGGHLLRGNVVNAAQGGGAGGGGENDLNINTNIITLLINIDQYLIPLSRSLL